MKKIIIVFNNAGGVGKTATVASLAGQMAEQGRRVLAVDLDPQATLTKQFLPAPPSVDIGAALRGGTVPIASVLFNFDLIPASPTLSDEIIGSDNYTCLAKLLEPMRKQYDFIIVDCPPSMGYLSRNAIAAADYILSPVLPDLKSIYGTQHLEDAIEAYATKNSPGIDGIFLTGFNRRRIMDLDVVAKLKEMYPQRLFDTKIRTCNKVRECLRAWCDVTTYAPRSNAAVDYRRLLNELIDRLQ